ncbi:uncharacterized protein PgNI_08042 [Pyricularia grisea]|uniref:Uncharacterized protein n=1 Tax=Pyricularia grisea TaxID=148305 RepID=A0A6P8AUY2_PYRGI|nr:uncharacterized protein PgNI_08042 [Pyricularia grisea]TLD06022.1 hypothetical protein PgNI_08042 [Pyricularia grisea]
MSSSSLLHGGTTALAALTTIFTPPPNCATSTWLLTTTEAPSEYPPFPTEGPSSCNIPRWEDNIDEGSYEFYSPAVCPSGFVVGPSCKSGQVKTSDDFPKVEAGETVAFCVPSGYTCTGDATDGGVWGMIQTGAGATQVTVAPAIQIRWRDFDLTLFPTHPLSPGVTIGVGPQSTPAPLSTPRTTGPAGGNGVIVVTLPNPARSTLLTSTTGTSAATTPPIANPNSASQQRVPDEEATSPARTARPDSATVTTVVSAGRSSQSTDLTKASPLESTDSHGLPLGPIILACLISVLIFGASVFFFSKRRRDRRDGPGAQPSLLPVGVGVWVGSSHGSESRRTKSSKPKMWRTWVTALRNKSNRQGGGGWPTDERAANDAKTEKSRLKDTMGWAGCPAAGTPGSKENPAELEQLGNGNDSEEQQRWSWVSRMFSIRASREGGQDEDDFKSSVMSSRRTTRSSRWTVSDAEGMIGERQHNLTAPGALWPPVPAVPRLPTPLPAVLISRPTSPTLTLRPLTARSAFTVRTETTEMSETFEENDMLSRLSPTRISYYTGAGGLLSPRESSRRLSHISGGTFGPGGGSRSSRNSHSRSSRATPES